MARGLMVSVLRGADDCTNGGISSKARHFLLIGDGVDGVFSDDDSTLPVLMLVRRMIGGKEYLHAEPRKADGSLEWRMFGGNFIYSSDSRFRALCQYPIPVHDRVER